MTRTSRITASVFLSLVAKRAREPLKRFHWLGFPRWCALERRVWEGGHVVSVIGGGAAVHSHGCGRPTVVFSLRGSCAGTSVERRYFVMVSQSRERKRCGQRTLPIFGYTVNGSKCNKSFLVLQLAFHGNDILYKYCTLFVRQAVSSRFCACV